MADSITRQPCAIILTAIRDEYMAVRSHLSQLQEVTHPHGTIYECGIFTSEKQTWNVGIVEIGSGNTRAAMEAERAITHFQPDLVFFVGVAGGLKDVTLGDVVVATKVYGYESGKANRTFLPRPEVGESSFHLVHRARAEGRKSDWLQRLGSPVPDPSPGVFIAPIAAGEKVVSSRHSAFYKFLTKNYGDALAVEMEGFGFLQVAHANQQILALIIRGISDLIDDKAEADAKNTQELAARHASAFAFEVLAKFGQEKTFEDFTKSQRAIKDFKDKVDGKWKEAKDDDGDILSQQKQFKDSAKYISKTLKNERKLVTFFPESESKVETADLPKTEEAFTEWYYKLGDYEQYYVLTTAVLHGAPVREVARYTESLYQFIHDEVVRRGNLSRINSRNGDQPESQNIESVRFSDPLLRTISGKELRRITFTKTLTKKGIECLYWQDADQYGLSTFGLHLLEFLCKEYIGKGELGQFFLNALQRWSEEHIGEVSRKTNHSEAGIGEVTSKASQSKESIDKVIRKAIDYEESIDEVNRKVIHSYGVVLWCHDAKTLGRRAKSWALENKPISTAELLDGAYEIYKVKNDENAINIGTPSVVLPLLKNWIKHIHKVLSTDEEDFEFEESKPKVDSRVASSNEAEKQVDTEETGKEKGDNLAKEKETGKEKGDNLAKEKEAGKEKDGNLVNEKETGKEKGDNLAKEKETGKEKDGNLVNEKEDSEKASVKQADTREDDIDEDEFLEEEFTTEVAIKLGCAVASTYALIGKRSPDIALEGLEKLLQLPLLNPDINLNDISPIFAAGVSTYVILSWSGRVRDVIEHLATSAEQLSHSRNLPRTSKKRHEYRRQRAVYLDVTLEAFFLIAVASSTDVQKVRGVQYSFSEPLPSQPVIPNPDGRDVLLAFLLSRSEVRCQEYITTLLCAAIVERKSRDAFGLLRYWAEIVLQRSESLGTDAEEMYRIYLQFIVYLGRTVEKWRFDLEQQKLLPPPAFETFKNRLKQWCTEGAFYSHPIGSLAREALEQLGD